MLISLLLLGCSINFATSEKSKIFTITSTTTLQRNEESISAFESGSSKDEIALKNILMSLLRKSNETGSFESNTDKMENIRSAELNNIYISFGNISAMLTNVYYADFSKLASSAVDITMKVQEGPLRRTIQINSTIASEKMSLVARTMLFGSVYAFSIELAKPSFHLIKLISEEVSEIKTYESETFTFDYITTNLQPKDFKTFLLGRNGLTTSLLQRIADSWLPPIIELLKKESLSRKIQYYEMKLRTDDKTSFRRRICQWIKIQDLFSANDVPVNHYEIKALNVSAFNVGSYKSCDSDFLSVEGSNILISLVLGYQSLYLDVSLSQKEVIVIPTTTPEGYDNGYQEDQYIPPPPPPIIRDYSTICDPLEIHTIETTIEFEIEQGNKIFKINNKLTNFNKQSPLNLSCPGVSRTQNTILHSALQDKLTEYLTELLISKIGGSQ